MQILKIKPHMLEPISAEKVPELYEAREGHPSVKLHLDNIKDNMTTSLQNVDARTVRGFIPINRAGDHVDGHLNLDGGATVPVGQTLNVDGRLNIGGSVTQVNGSNTGGVYGVSTVVASLCDIKIDSLDIVPIASFIPLSIGNFLIYIYFRIIDMETNVKIEITYTDFGGLQSVAALDKVYNVGSYSLAPIFINSIAMAPIILSVQANNVNTVFVSASVVGL